MLSGVLLILGGLSGTRVLVGTNSSGALVLVGAVVLFVGLLSLGSQVDEGLAESSDAARERDEEQYAEYERAKAALQAKNLALQRAADLEAAFAEAPEARQQVDALLARAGDDLTAAQRHELAIDLARRLRPGGMAQT